MARTLRLGALAACLGLLSVGVSGCSTDEPSAALPTQTANVGELEVKVTPRRLDATGATIAVVFDTHTGAPTIDVAANTRLTVNGTPWTAPTWVGDGPGGHHREGAVTFAAAGAATGTAQLTITGLARPITLTWALPAR